MIQSKYDKIIDKFLDSQSNIVKVEVTGLEAEYICAKLRERIDERILDKKIEVAVIEGKTYLGKKLTRATTKSSRNISKNMSVCPQCNVKLIEAPVTDIDSEGVAPTYTGSSHIYERAYELVCPKCGRVFGDPKGRIEY